MFTDPQERETQGPPFQNQGWAPSAFFVICNTVSAILPTKRRTYLHATRLLALMMLRMVQIACAAGKKNCNPQTH